MTGQYTRNGHVASTHDETNASMQAKARVVVGTEAILHRLRAASLVIFLDFDQHLLAPRFGVAEEALALISLAGRLVGARSSHLGHDFARRIVLQSRLPNHEVIAAALAGDPSLVRVPELARRGELKLPPFSSIALVSGESAPALIESLSEEDELETAPFDEIPATKKRPSSQRYLVRASDTETLCGAFARVGAVHPGVRIEVDPTNL
jgi:primosomal protein N' (replication factor Y)